MKKRYKALILLGIIFIGIPILLWLSWLLSPPRPISVFIMDKTSYSSQRIKHRAINWVMTYRKFTRIDNKLYNPATDYYGFFPLGINQYEINDLTELSPDEIKSLASQYHVAYYADSYGIFSDIWPVEDPEEFPAELIYGGLHANDFLFMENMINQKNLLIAELVFTSLSTRTLYREKAEELLKLRWQGWTGKFYHQFDITKESAVPPWVITLYENQYQRKWDFKNMGIVLVHEDETIVILEYPHHIQKPQPHIKTDLAQRRRFGVNNNIPYPGWFEITFPQDNLQEQTISWFDLNPTKEGLAILQKHNISAKFPAVIEFRDSKGNIIYLPGDYSYAPVSRRFIRMKGSKYIELFLSDLNDVTDRKAFFFGYYLPMFTKLFKDHQYNLATTR